jgi:hypothetical protein
LRRDGRVLDVLAQRVSGVTLQLGSGFVVSQLQSGRSCAPATQAGVPTSKKPLPMVAPTMR